MTTIHDLRVSQVPRHNRAAPRGPPPTRRRASPDAGGLRVSDVTDCSAGKGDDRIADSSSATGVSNSSSENNRRPILFSISC